MSMTKHLVENEYEVVPIIRDAAEKFGSSIPLILPNDYEYDITSKDIVKKNGVERTSLYIVPEAIKLLAEINLPVAVLAICGPMRTGKSYILSRLLGETEAFDLGHTFDPKTFGIWMGTKILKGKDKNGREQAVVLLDTEGIDAPSANVSQDASIMVLTILISSILIYNSTSVPYKKDLEKLDCFVRLAESFQVRRNQEIKVTEIAQYFPHFLWLLRDVSLITCEEDGKEMDPTDYIKQKVLTRGAAFKASKQDEIGRAIVTFFPDIQCKTLPIPHSNSEIMRDIAQHTDDLNPKFREEIQAFMTYLIEKVQNNGAKKGYENGSTVTGPLLCGLLKEYVNAVNDPNAIPCLDNAWQNTIDLLRSETMRELLAKYKSEMQLKIKAASERNGKVYPLEENTQQDNSRNGTLMGFHDEIMKNVTKELVQKIAHFGVAGVEDFKKNSQTLIETFQKQIIEVRTEKTSYVDSNGDKKSFDGVVVCGGVLLEFVRKNRELSREYCVSLYKELITPIKTRMENDVEQYTFKQLEEDFKELNEKYRKRSLGPEKWRVLNEMDKNTMEEQKSNFKKVKGYQEKAMKERQKAKEMENEALKRQEDIKKMHAEAIRERQKNAENLKNVQDNFQEQIEKMRKEEEVLRKEAMQKIQDLQNTNHADFKEMMAEFNNGQQKTLETMMTNLATEREHSAKQLAEMVEAIKNIPPPKVHVHGGGGKCVIM